MIEGLELQAWAITVNSESLTIFLVNWTSWLFFFKIIGNDVFDHIITWVTVDDYVPFLCSQVRKFIVVNKVNV
jgi:hypothetical protein